VDAVADSERPGAEVRRWEKWGSMTGPCPSRRGPGRHFDEETRQIRQVVQDGG